MSIRLVLADDHPLILDALQSLFRLEEDIEIVARCTDGAQAIEAVGSLEPDLLILDMRLPVVDGQEVLRALHAMGSRTRVVLLTGSIEDRELVDCLRLGVGGVALKDMAPRMLVQCVRAVHAGVFWGESQSVARALELMRMREEGAGEVAEHLTAREIEVVSMVAEGLRNAEIARRLTVTEGTVKVHLHSIYSKLGLAGRVELIRYAQDHGLA